MFCHNLAPLISFSFIDKAHNVSNSSENKRKEPKLSSPLIISTHIPAMQQQDRYNSMICPATILKLSFVLTEDLYQCANT